MSAAPDSRLQPARDRRSWLFAPVILLGIGLLAVILVGQLNVCGELRQALPEHCPIHALPSAAKTACFSARLMLGNHIAQNVADAPSSICASHLRATNILSWWSANAEMPLLRVAIHRAVLTNPHCRLQVRNGGKRLGKSRGRPKQEQPFLYCVLLIHNPCFVL